MQSSQNIADVINSVPGLRAGVFRAIDELPAEITKGNHTGAKFSVGTKDLSVGGAITDDIAVVADPLEDAHFTLSRKRAFFGSKVRVSAINGGVFISDKMELQTGQWSDVNVPFSVSSNGVEIQVRHKFNENYTCKIAAVLLFCISIVLGYAAIAPNAAPNIGEAFANNSFDVMQSGKNGNIAVAASLDSSDLERINDKLRNLQLEQLTTSFGSEEKVLMISGTYPEKQSRDWQSFLSWLDNAYPSITLLGDVKRTRKLAKSNNTDADTPSVSVIWFENGSGVAEWCNGRRGKYYCRPLEG